MTQTVDVWAPPFPVFRSLVFHSLCLQSWLWTLLMQPDEKRRVKKKRCFVSLNSQYYTPQLKSLMDIEGRAGLLGQDNKYVQRRKKLHTHKKNWARVYVTIVRLSESILVFGDMTDCPKYPAQELPPCHFCAICYRTEVKCGVYLDRLPF